MRDVADFFMVARLINLINRRHPASTSSTPSVRVEIHPKPQEQRSREINKFFCDGHKTTAQRYYVPVHHIVTQWRE